MTTTDELVATACPAINDMGWAFYFVPETLERGKEFGLDGLRFYFLGRGGVLGDVEAPVVASALGYFKPSLVEKMWNTAREKVDPREAARAYLECGAAFGRQQFSDLPGLEAFCAAAGAVNDAADPAALALYAGVAALPLADDPPARAMQLLTVLREYRGSAHLVAVVASGLTPREAHYIKRPDDWAMFGWGEDEVPEITEEHRARKAAAEELTDALVRPAYAAVDEEGARAVLDGLEAMGAALADEGG
ncbi:MAG TPA: hypothetical protein VK277_16225 [Acidimicrobiales bacterium]|nr:hypothetical protein [Acidimicrobiales bacterium]